VVDVNWGTGDVIVVFMEFSALIPQPVFSLVPGDAATFLDEWTTPTYSAGEAEFDDPAPLKNSAYRVAADAGLFLTSTAPAIDPDDTNGTHLNVLVFAIEDDNVDTALAQAKAGTKLIAPALCIFNPLNANLPTEVAPPGLLWGVQTRGFTPGVVLEWKLRYGEHRNPEAEPPPPNSMAQCYPLTTSYPGFSGGITATYTGYVLIAYRLDEGGTGTVYSKAPEVTDFTGTQILPPEWSVTIVHGDFPLVGIPFADPPPLISADVG
jgi:hypothetical protein